MCYFLSSSAKNHPPIANNFLKFFFALFAILTLNAATAWAESWTYTFKSPDAVKNNSITVNGATWNVKTTVGTGSPTISKGTYSKTYGLKFGSSKTNYYKTVVFTTDYFNNYNVSEVVVKILLNGGVNTTLTTKQGDITIGSASFKTSQQWTELTTNTTKGSGGQLSLTIATTQAFYISSITVNYEIPSVTPDPVDPTATFSNGSYTVGQTLDLSTLWNSNSEGAVTYSILEAGTTGASINDKSFTATAAGSCTVKASQAATSTYNAIDKTATITVTAPAPAAITLSEAGATSSVSGKYVGDSYTLPSTSSQTCGTKTFVGWSTEIIENSPTKPTAATYFEPDASVTLGATNTFYAVFAETGGTPTTTWSKTDIANIKSTDEVAITMSKGELMWALSSSKGTEDAPDAILVEQGTLEFAGALLWNIQNDEGNLTIYPNGTTSTWLYCTNTNNGVRVGTNANKTFTIYGNYLKNTATSRYVGVYITTSPDWRCYTSTTGNSNIAGQTLAFYKKTTTSGYKNYTTECAQTDCSLLKFTSNIAANQTAAYAQNATANTLTVSAEYDGNSTGVTYQWYSNTTNSNTNGTLITNATSASYKPSTTEVGTTYYYCVATYDECTITSNVATIVVNPTYTVTFDSDGGSAVTGQTIEKGKTATKPENPEKAGHTFVGWYNGDTEFDFDTPITGNITLKAKWTVNQYKVTLNPNYPDGKTGTFKDKSGNPISENLVLTYDYNTASMSLTDLYQSIELEGYQFNGWYSATSGGSHWIETGVIKKNVTVYAQWSKLYTITLSENGTTTEPTTQTSTTYKLPAELTAGSCLDDTKEFVGWTTNKELSSETTPTSDFYKKGETVTLSKDKTTFYAVFATVDGGGATDNTNVYTSNVSINAGTAITNTSVVIDQEEYNATKAGTGSAKGSVFVTIPAGTTYLSFYMAGWRGEGDKTITLTGAEAEPSSFKTIADNGVTGNGNYELEGNVAQYAYSTTLNNVTQETHITFSNGGADQRFVIWGVNASAGATYSNYSTTCVPAPKLVSIAQTAGQIEFTEGDEFVKATITATYEDESTKDVTSIATFSTPDMTQVGEQTISVSYKEGEVTAETSYKINIKEKTKYTITWWANGEEYYTQTAVEGTAIDVPTNSPNAATYACDDKVFVGWVDTEIIGSIDTKPTLITDFDKITENKDFFAVFATRSSSEPTAYTAGEVGDFVLAAKNSDKWYALPTNPTINSGKIQGVEIPVTTTNGVEHVTTANALGYTWTIANATNGQTISDGSKYIYHSNGGVDGTNLTYGIGTSFTWKIEKEDAGLTFKAMNGTTVNNRGMLMQGTQYGGYSLTNETTNGYYRISVLPIADAVSYSGYVTTCEKPIYTRVVKPGEYGTICLPYGSSDYTGAEFYEVSSVEYGKGLWLDQLAAGTALAAGKPYIFRAIAEKLAVVYKGEKKDSPVGGVNGLTGTFTAIAANSTLVGHYIIALNQIWVANDKNTLPAYRAYIDKDGVPTTEQPKLAGRRRVCMGENAATGLDNITNGENTTIKVIENGQLIIIRNGEKFNAQGQKL